MGATSLQATARELMSRVSHSLAAAAAPVARFLAMTIVALCLATTGILGQPATPATAASGFSMDLYFSSGYERQIDSRTCTAASTAMMLNFIARRDLGLSQRAILRYAQARDALNNRTQRGSDPLGWAKAATYYSPRTGKPTTYTWEATKYRSAALRRAARLIATTRKPVGLLFAGGKHAVVMTGFRATADPRSGDFRLTAVWISDPYGSRHTLYSVDRVPFYRYRELDATRTYDLAWYGKYVIVAPSATVTPAPAPTPSPTPSPSPSPTPPPEATPAPPPPAPTAAPTADPTPESSAAAETEPTPEPTAEPTPEATPEVTPEPTPDATASPSPET